ncbi:hypothetical protein GCM10007377_15150 [Galliscardovia ingluviei]|uniref:Antitoxin n=1 Tax=Galliscardovia ingluviei TaxID=1769422 RepID=A0A8J3ASB0_9BIFI|nr:type II toxin-antitoxin system Phd/YefM family antitoxin [Galliscardovia ingluviei]GGI15288.1 hypothetical protein GCM10007377_15150 [Galliscardovia ingluviei]
MVTTTATNFRRNLFGMLEQTIAYNEPITVSSKNGNVVVLSEEEYDNMMETLYLTSIPGMEQSIIEGKNTPVEDCIPVSEILS